MKRSWSALIVPAAMVLGLSACNKGDLDRIQQIKLPESPIAQQDDPSITKLTPDSHTLIYVSSNIQGTNFSINNAPFNNAKRFKVLVPQQELRITAKVKCYFELVQTAKATDFGPASTFEFTFTDRDRDRSGRERGCS
jgi:hypothetical protein